jgi:type I restriction enzyme, R subunit
VRRTMESRGKQKNLSFFAFTATPKHKTLAVFGTIGDDGKPRPFHLYSMRQAIEEKFILDVLQHYCTYGLYFKLSKAIEDDPELNKRKAAIAIGRFVSLHPHNIAQKTEIIIEHFRTVIRHKIGGKAKAMVVTGSRLHALRYYFAFKAYLKEKGYSDIVPLVAFSGKVIDTGYPEGVSESELNGFGEKELPEKFESDDYRILIVADKYQTGFDQPLLHTMYVDKRLSGVKAVQTLSRLNRIAAGKEDTFVLDFINNRDEILHSFQPYFESTTVDEPTDPDLLYDLKHQLDEKQVYWQSEIDNFVAVFFSGKEKKGDQAKLYEYTQPAVDRFKAMPLEDRDVFKKQMGQWIRLYAFLSQLLPFPDAELEKYYTYCRLLYNRLPGTELSERLRLEGEINLKYYRLEMASEGRIALEPGAEYGLSGQTETGLKRSEDEKERLSKIIDIVNERFGTDFREGDQLFIDSLTSDMIDDEKLQQYAKNNTIDNFELAFNELFLDLMVTRMDQNQDIFDRIMNEKEFGDVVKKWILRQVYDRINAA